MIIEIIFSDFYELYNIFINYLNIIIDVSGISCICIFVFNTAYNISINEKFKLNPNKLKYCNICIL